MAKESIESRIAEIYAAESRRVLATLTTMIVRKGEGDEVSVTDGPFIEGKELIPRFTVIRMDTKQEAIEWAGRYREMIGMPELRIAEVFG